MTEEDFWNYAQIAFLQGRIDRVLRGELNGWDLLAELAFEPMNDVEAIMSDVGIFVRVYGVEVNCPAQYDITAALQFWYLEADKVLKDASRTLRDSRADGDE